MNELSKMPLKEKLVVALRIVFTVALVSGIVWEIFWPNPNRVRSIVRIALWLFLLYSQIRFLQNKFRRQQANESVNP